jgi:hypothetical protein
VNSSSAQTKPRCAGQIASLRGLGENCHLGADATLDEFPHSNARVFFVGHGGDENLPSGGIAYFVERERGSGAHCRDTRFHVGRAASENAIIAYVGIERRVRHPFNAHDIEMSREHHSRGRRERQCGQ